jgi:hypothetical protein
MSESPEKRYSKSDLNDLKARIDLAALVGQTVELKRVGKNLMGICPLHPDEKPSLSVNGQLWKCFGCDAGGDVVEWIRLKEKLEFPQIKARMLELANQLPDAEPSSPKPPTELGVRFSRTGLPPETFARLYKRLANTGLGQVKPIIGPSLLSLVGNPYTQGVKRLLSLLLVALTLWSLAFPALALNLEAPKHPSTARMRVRPKLGEGVDLNLYRYCGNSSPNYSDPSGLGWLGVTAYIHKPAQTMIVVDPIAQLVTMPFPALEWFTNPVLMMHVDKLTCDGWKSTNIVSVWSMRNGQLPAIMRGVGAYDLKNVSIDTGSPEFKDAIGIRIVMELKARDQHNVLQSANLVHVERLPASKPSPNGQKCGCPR